MLTFEEADGKLERTGKDSIVFIFRAGISDEVWFVSAPEEETLPAEPMMDVRAAANADWKLGSEVIALVAAAMVSDGRFCCVELRMVFWRYDW